MAQQVFNAFFQDTHPLVKHHIDSYADFLNTKLPAFLKGSNPRRLTLSDGRTIDIYVGGRDGSSIAYKPPTDGPDGGALLPHACRLGNRTYAIEVRGTIDIVYTIGGQETVKSFEDVMIGKIPLMLQSQLCYLSSMTPDQLYEAGECKFEPGGYFIIGGSEKVLLTQEKLGNNLFYAGTRVFKDPKVSSGLAEKGTEASIKGGKERSEFYSGVRSASEDGTRGPYSHFLVIPPASVMSEEIPPSKQFESYADDAATRLAAITLPGFIEAVPLLSVFRALGIATDQDLYNTVLAGVPVADRRRYDMILTELILSHEYYIRRENKEDTQDPDLYVLRRQTRERSIASVVTNIKDKLFPHCTLQTNRSKAYLLGHMTRLALDVALGGPTTDRDHFRFKRFDGSGDLCFQEFRRIFNEVANRMTLDLDTRIHYEQKAYEGQKLAQLVQEERIGYYWKGYTFMNEFEKSFKGKWGGNDGVSQELSRSSFLATLAHLRRVNLQMDRGSKIIESRRLHGSSWGFMCPTDNPDGRNIGMIKSFALFCEVTTSSPAKDVLALIADESDFKITPVTDIHPSAWDPTWTRVFLNSELIGVHAGDTEALHKFLMKERRGNNINLSTCLSWDRLQNIYTIWTDAGRVIRPVYRKGMTEAVVKSVIEKNQFWWHIGDLFEFIDPQEAETTRISMEPFSEDTVSEIHGSVIFSASGSVIPHPDFNQAPRNMFSCQQTKHACAWFNTAFNKRFDTISAWLNYAQRPLSHTWTYNPMLGCMPYGENAIVALAIYSGYNQEDSILLNDSALRRGLFNTSYYHSYDVAETMIDPVLQTHSQIVNLVQDSKFKESVTRKEGYNYELLDANGIVRVGSHVDDHTILAGIVTPTYDNAGNLVGYNDSSYTPKRGQHGVIDAVYVYNTPENLKGVKVRIVESRIPSMGDKFSARHGQKGTVGIRVPEEDMPFTSTGLRPDMIVNPHAFPSRMTIGQFVETMSTKLGVHMGCSVDSTPFSASNRVPEMKNLLEKAGFHPYGHEVLYSGHTGEMILSEIFMGPTYYMRLKQMVEDKINYRTTGPKTLLTHQPVGGRAQDGGLRIGEMERDSLISHGVSKFLHESLMDRSDEATVLFEPETGALDARDGQVVGQLNMPYAMSILSKEIEAMHISMKLISS